jgi:signal transduction histidine kinase
VRTRLSLRARATVLALLLFAALLTTGSVLLVSTLESRLTEVSDQVSRSRVEELLAMARTGELPQTLRNVDDNGVAQVVAGDHTVLASSENVAGDPPIADLHPGRRAATSTFRAPDDHQTETYRFWYASGPGPTGTVTVYVGDSLEAVSEASAALRRALWVGVPGVLVLLGLGIWLLLGRVIGRLDRIRAEVDRISEQNLDSRVAGDGVDDEVGRLAATMNAMLGRLDAAAQRQRNFVADVSHDLQSPLAAQRVALDVALARPEAIDARILREDVLGATNDLERLVGELLVLASIDAGKASPAALIDLDGIVLEEASRARSNGRVEIDTSRISAAPAYANADDVRRVVRNLLDNAIAHARTRVVLTVSGLEHPDAGGDRSWAQLLVADDGTGVPPEQRDRIFERFYRAESARSPGSGSGLGLSIARGLAERNRGRVDLVEPGAGATLRLLLPPAPPTDRRSAADHAGYTR